VAPVAPVSPFNVARAVFDMSAATIVPSLIFADVTAFFLICFVPTEFFGSCVTA
jgi:hypothetical protein